MMKARQLTVLFLSLALLAALTVPALAAGPAVYDGEPITAITEYPDGLYIRSVGELLDNDTMSYTLTVDGLEVDIAAGQTYLGDCVITPTAVDSLTASGPGGEVTENYRTAIYIDDSGVNDDLSVLAAVRMEEDSVLSDTLVKGVSIRSQGVSFGGVKLAADGYDKTYTIDDATILLDGIGGDDFRGYGAGIYVKGDTNAEITNSYIETWGSTREGICVGTTAMSGGGSPVAHIRDTVVIAHSSDFEEWQQAHVPMMSRIPFGLMSTGNVRATVALGTGEAHYENCAVVSESWAALSTDTGSGDMLYAENTLAGIGSLEVARPGVDYTATKEIGGVTYGYTMPEPGEVVGGWISSGYAAFADGGINDYFTNCEFYSPDTVLIVGGTSKAVFDGGKYTAGTTGVFWYSSSVGSASGEPSGDSAGEAEADEPTVYVKDARWDVGRTLFLVRTGTPYILVENSDVAMGEDGVLVQLYDNDDTNGIATNVMIIGSDGAAYYADRDSVPQLAATSNTAVAEFTDGDYAGDIYNGMSETYITLRAVIRNGSLTGAVSSSIANHVDLDGNALKTGFVIAAPYATDEEIVIGAQAIDPSIASIDQLTEGVDYIRHDRYYAFNGRVGNDPIEAVNNPVELTLDNAVWNVTGTSYLTRLEIGEGSAVNGVLTVDGETVEAAPGVYTGHILVTP